MEEKRKVRMDRWRRESEDQEEGMRGGCDVGACRMAYEPRYVVQFTLDVAS